MEIKIYEIDSKDKKILSEIVDIHTAAFKGFFLTFMGKGFLKLMYKCYCKHESSNILVAFEESNPIGFLAYSEDLSGLYKFMLKRHFIGFAWYSMLACIRRPKYFMRLIRALNKPNEAKCEDKYVKITSICVNPDHNSKGIGSKLIEAIKTKIGSADYKYILLETDAEKNEAVNQFYLKNGFVLKSQIVTHEGRKMNEYIWSVQ